METADGVYFELGHGLRLLRAGGLSTPFLFDLYGAKPSTESLEARVYRDVALSVETSMSLLRQRIRSGTHFRMSGALLAELYGAKLCGSCNGSGVDRAGVGCMACFSTGLDPFSRKWRADMCGCRYNDFRDRLNGLYQQTLLVLARKMVGRTGGRLIHYPKRVAEPIVVHQ